MIAGERETVYVPAGQVLNVVATAPGVCTVTSLDPGTSVPNGTPVAVSATTSFGPFQTLKVYLVAVTTGPVVWSLGTVAVVPPHRSSTLNATVGTLPAGALTGARLVILISTNATPGTQTTRTAAEMIADHGAIPGDVWLVKICNTGAGTLTLGAGAGVTITGTATVAQNTYREFKVTVDSAAGMTFLNVGGGTYSA